MQFHVKVNAVTALAATAVVSAPKEVKTKENQASKANKQSHFI